MPVTASRYVNEFFAAPSPDGKTLAFSARGVASHQWWRNGHSHLDESELWLMEIDGKDSYKQITERGAKHLWPMWHPDGQSLYFISDREGAENLYVRSHEGKIQQLTQFRSGRCLWPNISANGKTIVFERDFQIWVYDIASGKTYRPDISCRGSATDTELRHVQLTSGFKNATLSPDRKKMAFTIRGKIFVAPVQEESNAKNITGSGIASDITWDSSSNILLYSCNKEGTTHIYEYNFLTQQETKITEGTADYEAPRISPDGRMLSFIKDGTELIVMNRVSKSRYTIAKGYIGRPPFSSINGYSWSPDSKWIAYAAYGKKAFRNIYITEVANGQSREVSFLANSFSDNVTWSKDGKFILFNTGQRTENGAIARIDLVPRIPQFTEKQFQDLFAAPPPPEHIDEKKKNNASTSKSKKKPATGKESIQIKWEDIKQRIQLLPIGADIASHTISPDGNTLALVASVAEQQNIFIYSLDEKATEPAVLKQITSSAFPKTNIQFTEDGKDIYFTGQGKIFSVNVESQQVKPLAATAEMDIDFNKDKHALFELTWDILNKGFYDTGFHGADWNAIKAQYEPVAGGARNIEDLRRTLSLMVGELNASHLGIGGTAQQFNTGRIGLLYDRVTYEEIGKLKITEVISSGPADIAGNINVGEYLLTIDDIPVDKSTNIDALLMNKGGKMVTLGISAAADDRNLKKIAVRPVSYAAEKGLLYKQWVNQRREYVNRISNNRLGYVHMFDMTQESLDRFYLDIDAENHAKEGVVVDIRNNNGGFVNAYALDVLSRKGYMTMTVRGLPSAPARVQLGQRSLEAPTILITNQHSLSDAEDFSEGYRKMQLGKIVGEPTGGWIIYTGNLTLFDGTVVRLPFIKITDSKGEDMELNPRPVDIEVSNPLGQPDKDNQLDTAVTELLKEIDTR